MKFNELFPHTFKAMSATLKLHDPRPYWASRLSSESSFCRAAVKAGYLTQAQMEHAAQRYRLGRSRDDAVIYWQIDQEDRVRDGKLMWYGDDCHRLKHRKATWVSFLLRKHYQLPDDYCQTSHCFFGLHLLREKGLPIAIVEAEKTAVILSELYPRYIWLAAGGLGEVQTDKFRPLRGHPVIMFPDTDLKGMAFHYWYEVAEAVMRSVFWEGCPPIRVSPILELNATPEQKLRKIDLIEFLYES